MQSQVFFCHVLLAMPPFSYNGKSVSQFAHKFLGKTITRNRKLNLELKQLHITISGLNSYQHNHGFLGFQFTQISDYNPWLNLWRQDIVPTKIKLTNKIDQDFY